MNAVDAGVQPVGVELAMAAPVVEPNVGRTAFANLVAAYRRGQPTLWTQAEAAIQAQGASALPALLEGLKSPDRQTRELGAMMLAQVLPTLLYAEDFRQRPNTERLAERLRPALRDESVEVRVNVAVGLSLIEGQGPTLIPVLQELLASELPHVRTMAVVALGGLGMQAASAIPAMERLSQTDQDPAVKSAAQEAISQIRSLQ